MHLCSNGGCIEVIEEGAFLLQRSFIFIIYGMIGQGLYAAIIFCSCDSCCHTTSNLNISLALYLNRKKQMSQDGDSEDRKPSFNHEPMKTNKDTPEDSFSNLKQPASSVLKNEFALFDQIIEQIPVDSQPADQEQVKEQQEEVASPKKKDSPKKEDEAIPKKEDVAIIEQVEKEWIIKQAEMQRIGGTYDFFFDQVTKYGRHMIARKSVLTNVSTSIEQCKEMKAKLIILLKEYFRDYASVCEYFHERSYKYQMPQREESESIIINLRVELKTGFERLINMRKNTGNDLRRLEKIIKETVIAKIDKAIIHYWGSANTFLGKAKAKQQSFFDLEKKFIKRIDKVTKLYTKGRFGTEIDEDLFIEMAKFVRDERELRLAILEWSRQIYSLRKALMNADYALISELEAILSEYKNFNSTIYQLQKKKSNFIERLKEQIEANFDFQRLCTPLDNDYILGIVNFRNRSSQSLIRAKDYEQFLTQQYFGIVIGDICQFLKGTLVKSFPLKFQNEELVRTVSGNLIYYDKNTLDIINKFKVANTTAQFEGQGCVNLKEFVKGIIFDSENKQKIYFRDDNRAEELVLYLQTSIGVDLA